jgi:hypothetical protein
MQRYRCRSRGPEEKTPAWAARLWQQRSSLAEERKFLEAVKQVKGSGFSDRLKRKLLRNIILGRP